MHSFRLTLAVAVMIALHLPLSAQTQPPQPPGDEAVRLTVTEFWRSLGELDANGLSRTLDWPNVVFETKPDRPTHPAKVNTDAATLEAEVRRTAERLTGNRKGDFFGTTVSSVEVRFLHSTLAYAHHICRLPESARSSRDGRDFEAIAILRATGNSIEPWKIILITIPK